MSKERKILNVRFNQDYECLSCALESGVRIYNVTPLVEKCHYDTETMGSVAICEMLYRTNLLAIVSGGTRPKFSDNKLMIFDDLTKKFILEISFLSPIKAVRWKMDKIFVVLMTSIHVFSFPSPTQRLFSLTTTPNPRGLCELSASGATDKELLIFPGYKVGSVQILDLAKTEIGASSAPVTVTAHENELACMAFNHDATKFATASVRGTLIRVFDTATKTLYIEFRRGHDQATIYSLSFNKDSEFLCSSSDKGTVHIYAVKNPNHNKRLKFFRIQLGNLCNSLWGLASFSLPPECPCVCAFTENNAVVAACLDGTFHKYVFTRDGNCNKESFDKFLDIYDEDNENF